MKQDRRLDTKNWIRGLIVLAGSKGTKITDCRVVLTHLFCEGLAAIPGASEEIVAFTIYQVPGSNKAMDLQWPAQAIT
jgi:hypothetical protein